MIKHFLILCMGLLLPLGGNSQDIYSQLEAELEDKLSQIVEQNQIPGATFSLYLDAQHQINLAAGYADLEAKKPMQSNSRMLAGSVGKIFFSTVFLKLIQEGKLDLEEKALKYLEDEEWFKSFPNHADIKIIHLMNHSSGLPRHLFQSEFLSDFVKNPLKKRLPKDCIQSIANKAPLHAPGKSWAYSDTNYILLGLIVEKITSQKVYDLVQKELIEPLQLQLTQASTEIQLEGLAQGYVGAQNPFQLPQQILNEKGEMCLDPSFEWTGGGFISNPQDLTRLLIFIHQSDYLNAATKEKLHSAISTQTGLPYDQGYGLGTFVWSKMNDTRYGHPGFFPGYVTHAEYSSKRQYALAIQVNSDGQSAYLASYLYQMEEIIAHYMDRLDEAKVLQNFKEQEKAWNQADLKGYMEAYAKKVPIQTASRAGITHGYDKILANYRKYYSKDKMGKLFFDELQTRRLADDLYFVSGRFNLSLPPSDSLRQGWFTVVLQKIEGEWYMITDHSS